MNMYKKVKPAVIKRTAALFLLLLPFVIIYLLSKGWLRDIYMVEWTGRNSFWYVWVLVTALVAFGKYRYAVSVTAGNILGIVIGQVLGDIIVSYSRRTFPDAYEWTHYGVFIWLITIAVCFVICFVISYEKIKPGLIKRTVTLFLLLLPFMVIHALSLSLLHNVYMVEWMGHNSFWYVWVLVISLVAFGKYRYAVSVTAGNILGIVIGQVLGDIIYNYQRINYPDANEWNHYGVFIWLITIAVCLAVCAVVRILHLFKERSTK